MGAPEWSETEPHHGRDRILVGFPDMLVADAFARLFSEAGFDIAGCCGQHDALLEAVASSLPDLVVVGPEVDAPDGSSRCLASLREVAPSCPIVVMLRDLDAPHARALVRYSINGVIPLAARSSEAITIVRQVMDGHVVYPTGILGLLAGASEPELLSERQREVLHQLALGRSNDEIAQRLFISRNTVKFHLREIYERLGVRNRVEAARVAQQVIA
jgi:DNA-binding NarL/FixJ family response regulator